MSSIRIALVSVLAVATLLVGGSRVEHVAFISHVTAASSLAASLAASPAGMPEECCD